MKVVLKLLCFIIPFFSNGQIPLFQYRDVKETLVIPPSLTSERSVVIVHVPDQVAETRSVGNWQQPAQLAHKAFATMGIDAVTYVNHYDLVSSENSRKAYSDLFTKRKIRHLIFLVENAGIYQLVIARFNGDPSFMDNGAEVFSYSDVQLSNVLLQTGKEVRRADLERENFLIPDKPNFAAGISVVQKSRLDNYPGILRRSKLSVERFAPLRIPTNASDETIAKIENYNQQVTTKNEELVQLLKDYPYEYELIDKMSDEDLLRSRRQFVLRSISGRATTLRIMLDYPVNPNVTDFVSIIPIMPDQTKAKPISRNAIVYKFYIRQNISKNIHVGEWDADTSWQDALRNMIGNLIQEHNVSK